MKHFFLFFSIISLTVNLSIAQHSEWNVAGSLTSLKLRYGNHDNSIANKRKEQSDKMIPSVGLHLNYNYIFKITLGYFQESI